MQVDLAMNRDSSTDPAATVEICFASLNTKRASELCLLSMRARAQHPFHLKVGDCGSNDGSIEMFQRYEQRGRLALEVAPNGRTHAQWLNHWFCATECRYLVFCDSDIEFLQAGWLATMMRTALESGAALVATRIQAESGIAYTNPKTGAVRTLAPRPEPWLMLMDTVQISQCFQPDFSYRDQVHDDGTKTAFDVGAVFYEQLLSHSLKCATLADTFQDSYHHFGGLTWLRRGISWKQQARQVVKRAWVTSRWLRAKALYR